MSWASVASVFDRMFRSKWMRDQAPHVAVLFCILFMIAFYAFMVRPAERAEERAADERLVASIKAGYSEQEVQHSAQSAADREVFREVNAQNIALIQSLLRGKVEGVAKAMKMIGGNFAANVSAEQDGGEQECP